MPNPNTNFKLSDGRDLGSVGLTKEYLMTVYPQIANQLITPELWVWGFNNAGQLGDNTIVDRSTPVTTSGGGANWKQVSSNGNSHCAAIKTDGTLWVWGFNNHGQLGTNDTNNKCTPVTTFAGGTNWKQVYCGNVHTAAIKTDGTLWTWGYNAYGGLGINDTNNRTTPVTTFAGGTNWKQVDGGALYTVAIKTDGTLWAWGRNFYGNLGTGDTNNRTTPVTTSAGGTNWKQVVCSPTAHTVAIKTDGTLWAWGFNNNGQLGINDTNNRTTPVTTSAGGTNWKQVDCGNYYTAAIKTDGTLWMWGNGGNGLLGINDTNPRCTPITTFAGGTNWKQVACGPTNVSAIKTDGTLWMWGDNGFGQLGINNITRRCTPVTTFAGGTNWKQVSVGYHTAAIKTSDDLLGI